MVYMAGDNGKQIEGRQLFAPMEGEARRDFRKMQAVGSTPELAILIQFDTLSDREASYRLQVQPAGQPQPWVEIPEQNSGDPRSLISFVLWCMDQAPAERYAVVLWSHGTGWKEDDIYAFARKRQVELAAGEDEVRSATGHRRNLSSSLFLPATLNILRMEDDESRGIAYDDSSMDFMNNAELQQAFAEIQQRSGQRVDLIGMDACLMSTVEIAYQLREQAGYLVASQALEPMEGWPYLSILRKLAAEPELSPADLAVLVVEEYSRHYTESGRGSHVQITQSAVDLSRLESLAAHTSCLVRLLEPALGEDDFFAQSALDQARQGAVRLYEDIEHRIADNVDLYDLLVLLRDEYRGYEPEWPATIQRFLDAFAGDAGARPVLAREAMGPGGMERTGGLSIYLPPPGVYSDFYDGLDFARLGWGAFLRQLSQVRPV
jgi:hypothetical protein